MRKAFFISVICILLGRAYQYLFWDAPLRALIWDESLMSKPIKLLTGLNWQEYANHTATNHYIRWYSVIVAAIFILAILAIVAVQFGSHRRWIWFPVIASSGILLFHSLLDMKDKFYHVAQVLEPSIQITAPVIFLLWHFGKIKSRISLKNILKMVVGICFAAHGLYAIGFYPVPGHFIDMTILSLGISEDQSRILLQIVGWMDLALIIALFLPFLEKFAIWYGIIWGLLTALARIWSGIDIDFLWSSIHEHLYLTIYRLAHGLIPLTIYLIVRNSKKNVFKVEFNKPSN